MLTALQNQIKTLLEAHSWFPANSVLTEEKGDLLYDLDSAVDAVGGLAVAVIIPQGLPDGESEPGRVKVRLQVAVNLVESFSLNQTGKHARDGVVPVIEALHGQWSGLGSQAIRGRSTNRLLFINYEQVPDPGGLTTYQVRFETRLNITTEKLTS